MSNPNGRVQEPAAGRYHVRSVEQYGDEPRRYERYDNEDVQGTIQQESTQVQPSARERYMTPRYPPSSSQSTYETATTSSFASYHKGETYEIRASRLPASEPEPASSYHPSGPGGYNQLRDDPLLNSMSRLIVEEAAGCEPHYQTTTSALPATQPVYLSSSTGYASGSSWDGKSTVSYQPQAPEVNNPVIVGTPGDAEKLDSSYRIRNHDYKKFFRVGRVFSTLWTENVSDRRGSSDTFRSVVVYEEGVNSKVRRFVVVREENRSVTCLPVTSYDGNGYRATGINIAEHGLIYGSNYPKRKHPDLLRIPLKIVLSRGSPKLPDPLLVNYRKVYTVETNVKVKDIGDLDADSKSTLIRYFEKVFIDHKNDDIDGEVGRPYPGSQAVVGKAGGPPALYPLQQQALPPVYASYSAGNMAYATTPGYPVNPGPATYQATYPVPATSYAANSRDYYFSNDAAPPEANTYPAVAVSTTRYNDSYAVNSSSYGSCVPYDPASGTSTYSASYAATSPSQETPQQSYPLTSSYRSGGDGQYKATEEYYVPRPHGVMVDGDENSGTELLKLEKSKASRARRESLSGRADRRRRR